MHITDKTLNDSLDTPAFKQPKYQLKVSKRPQFHLKTPEKLEFHLQTPGESLTTVQPHCNCQELNKKFGKL